MDLCNNEEEVDREDNFSSKEIVQQRRHKRSISESMNHFGENLEDFKFLHSIYINKDKSELFNLISSKPEKKEPSYFNHGMNLTNEPIKKEIISPISPYNETDIFSQNQKERRKDEEFIKNSLKFMDNEEDSLKLQKPPGLEMNFSVKSSKESSIHQSSSKKTEQDDVQVYEHKLPFKKNQAQANEENQGDFAAPRKPIILDEGKSRYSGKLKFFDETKNFGFIVMDDDGSDVFVHYDDLLKSGFDKEYLKAAKTGTVMRFSFSCMSYIGRYNKSRKAVEISLLEGPPPF